MLTKEYLEQRLSYNHETGELKWLYSFQRPDVIGQRAGWFDTSTGYWKIAINGHNYMASCIIWLLVYGVLPDTVDHADTNKANDQLDNLRLATKGQNAANSKISARNTSGFKGVSFCNTTGKWRASITINGTSKNLGRHTTPELAHEAWKEAAIAAFGEEFVRAA